jgi:DNA-directed RNA polymerase subunit H (RpoH/RPB5)
MKSSSTIIASIHASRNTLLAYAERLNYNVDDYTGTSIAEINAMHTNDQLDMIITNNENDPVTGNPQKIYIQYHIRSLLRNAAAALDSTYNDLFVLNDILSKNDTLIIVIDGDVNDTVQTILKDMYEKYKVLISVQSLKNLQFNIFENDNVPKHTIVSETESNVIAKKYNIMNNSQYPNISRFDPAAQAMCMHPGQLCMINRKSNNAMFQIMYRVCINL